MEERKISERDFAIERITSTYERIIKRLWILCIIIFLVCSVMTTGLLYYTAQYESVTETEVTQENEEGDNNYIGNNGDITNGEASN